MSFTRDLQARALTETESTWWGLLDAKAGASSRFFDIHQLANNDLILCGRSGFGTDDLYHITVVKLTALGEYIWGYAFGSGRAEPASCLITDNEDILLVGNNIVPSLFGFILKIDQQGHILWGKRINAPTVSALPQLLSTFKCGPHKTAATMQYPTSGNTVCGLIFFNLTSGHLENLETIQDGSWYCRKPAGTIDQLSNIFMTGSTDTSTAAKLFLAKINNATELSWAYYLDEGSSYHTAGNTDANAIILDPMSNLITASIRQKVGDSSTRQFLIGNFSQSGEKNWLVNLGRTSTTSTIFYTVGAVHSLTIDEDNHLLFLGFGNTARHHNIYLTKFSHAGTPLWTKEIMGTFRDEASSLLVLGDGRILISGSIEAYSEDVPQAFVAQLSSDGNLNISTAAPIEINDITLPYSSSSANLVTWSPSLSETTPLYRDWDDLIATNVSADSYTRYDFIGVTATASASATASMTPSQSASPTTSTSPSHSASFSASSTASGSSSASKTHSSTGSSTATPSATLTNTPSATLSATRSSTLTPTPSGSSSATHSATASITPTRTASPSTSASSTSTASSSITDSTSTTATCSSTASPSTSSSASMSSSHTATSSSTTTASATASVTASSSASNTGSSSLTASPSRTTTSSSSTSTSITASTSPSVSPTQSSSASLSASASSTATPSASLTASPSSSNTPSPTATRSGTSSLSASKSTTPTSSSSTSVTSSASPSATTSSSASLSTSSTSSISPSTTASVTASTSMTPSITQSTSHSATSTASATPSLSPNYSVTQSSTVSTTASSSVSSTASMSSSSSVSATSTASQSPSVVFSTSSSATDTASMSASASASASATPSSSYTAPASINRSLSASPSASNSTNLDDALQEASSSNNTMIIIGAVVIVGVVAPTAFFLWRCHANKTKHRRLVSPSKRPTSPTSTPNLWTSAAGDNNARPISPPSSAAGKPARPARQPHHRRRKKHRKHRHQPRRIDSHSVQVRVPSR